MRTFSLIRREDVSGVSGTGHVADGAVFDDGTTVLHWRTNTPSTAVYDSLEAAKAVHEHGGKTVFMFETEPHSAGWKAGAEATLAACLVRIWTHGYNTVAVMPLPEPPAVKL